MADPVIDTIMAGHFERAQRKDPLEGKCYADNEDWPCLAIRNARDERGPIKFLGRTTKTGSNPFRRE